MSEMFESVDGKLYLTKAQAEQANFLAHNRPRAARIAAATEIIARKLYHQENATNRLALSWERVAEETRDHWRRKARRYVYLLDNAGMLVSTHQDMSLEVAQAILNNEHLDHNIETAREFAEIVLTAVTTVERAKREGTTEQ